MRPALPEGLYGIADASFGDPAPAALALARAGCRAVQLRDKRSPPDRIAACARALLPALRAQGALLIINDHLDVAVAVGADGLHLGQEDGALEAARARLGPRALLGRSAHTLDQIRAARREGADYVGFGPIFSTDTKQTGRPPQGLERLAQAIAAADPLPLVAIGGIRAQHLPGLRAAGARYWAAIGAILAEPDIAAAARPFLAVE